ncbi:MAG: hypothetical protein K1X81_01850 [Bacteroidia bacterium]|nr:hypothetical protein [Bacteroidia bacterium]
MAKRQVKVTTAWVTVKAVDWDEKTMTATGLMDDLDYNDVLLGIGSVYTKPKQGTKALIGLIENQDAATFLIECEEVEEMLINSLQITFNDGNNKGLVKVDPLKTELQKLNTNNTILKNAAAAAITTLSGLLDGGATATTFNTAVAGMQTQNLTQLENDKVKH